MIEAQIRGAIYGVLLGEVFQLGLWKMAHPGRPIRGYFDDGLGHMLMCWSVCALATALWAYEGLDWIMVKVIERLPESVRGDWGPNVGVPYTFPVGICMTFGLDFVGDKVALAIRARAASLPILSWFLRESPTAPGPTPPPAGS